MADALKAEGNKAFSAKDYPTAMYVPYPAFDDVRNADDATVRNSLKPLPSNPKTISYTPTGPLSMLLRQNTKRPLTTPTRRLASSRTGPKAMLAKELPIGVWEISVSWLDT